MISKKSETNSTTHDQSGADLIDVRLNAIHYGGREINLFELVSTDGADLPAFTAGAHVDVHLRTGLVRQYSIASSVTDQSRYLLGVKLNASGRGGSRAFHDALRVGDVLQIGRPRNLFALSDAASPSVLIAGGIGITPIFCMVDTLHRTNRHWSLHYAVATREDAILFDMLPSTGQAFLHVDSENAGRKLNLREICARAGEDAHLYCCGPSPMLDAFQEATIGRPASHLHLERFSASELAGAGVGYRVKLAKSQREVVVTAGQSLLEALRKAGVEVNVSCQQGICGTCETRVLEGIPDHRDTILSDEEKASNSSMMVCCSGCLGSGLTLDL